MRHRIPRSPRPRSLPLLCLPTRLAGPIPPTICCAPFHPDTIQQIGRRRFEEIVGGLRYGAIAINAWTGLAFLIAACPWGAFPGHRLNDVGSGIGFAHNSVMFDRSERTVITGPWRPFPRSILHGRPDFLPRPPWFVTNRRQHVIGRLLTSFQHRPRWFKLPRILLNALRG